MKLLPTLLFHICLLVYSSPLLHGVCCPHRWFSFAARAAALVSDPAIGVGRWLCVLCTIGSDRIVAEAQVGLGVGTVQDGYQVYRFSSRLDWSIRLLGKSSAIEKQLICMNSMASFGVVSTSFGVWFLTRQHKKAIATWASATIFEP